MTGSDDSILEVLEESDSALSMKGIEVNSYVLGNTIPYPTIQRRVPKLVEAGLIDQLEEYDKWYLISEDGSAYLEGEHTPPDLED
ncbi:ArsR family transcriptional regulator [Halohasta litorea]|uniref:ArsR family transcriptional regulator n=1 Tax=Halohasta litorea TaxID=869891 RepID=A0ABD6D7I7_9EURY|nr:ArsR family transcriptional regulator [Halohasta litorea]